VRLEFCGSTFVFLSPEGEGQGEGNVQLNSPQLPVFPEDRFHSPRAIMASSTRLPRTTRLRNQKLRQEMTCRRLRTAIMDSDEHEDVLRIRLGDSTKKSK